MNEPTHLDICSGIGGFSLAFESAGFRTIAFSEVDSYASAVLRKHWPDVPSLGDLRTISSGKLHFSHGTIDCVTAGVPCQPASLAGRRRGSRDERWLWDYILGLVGRLGPRYAVFENPTGLFTLDGGRAFERILGTLWEIGFDAWWEVVPACAAGADHPRERIIIIAANAAIKRIRPVSDREEWKKDTNVDWRHTLPTAASLGWGSFESYFLRNVHGIPKRMDRIRCLGNSVVPQVIYPFAKAIREALEKES